MLAPLATMPAVEGLAAERATGLGPGAAARRARGTPPVSNGSRLRLAGLAGLAGLEARRPPAISPAGSTPRWRPLDRG
jgi:hypothetical protein